MKQDSVLITGGFGFVGSLLTKKLLERGYDVCVYDSCRVSVPLCFAIPQCKLRIIADDIRNAANYKHILNSYETVIHLAAIGGYNACDQNVGLATDVNVNGTAALLSAISPEQQFIFASSCSLYGSASSVVDEKTAPAPLTTYAITKHEAEKMVLKDAKLALRFPTLYGPSIQMRLDLLVNNFCYQAVKKGDLKFFNAEYIRPFLHVDDAVRAYEFALDNYDRLKGTVYNVGGDSLNYSIGNIAKIVAGCDSKVKLTETTGVDRDKRNYEVKFDKFKIAGYKTTKRIEDTVADVMGMVRLMNDKLIDESFYAIDSHRLCFAWDLSNSTAGPKKDVKDKVVFGNQVIPRG